MRANKCWRLALTTPRVPVRRAARAALTALADRVVALLVRRGASPLRSYGVTVLAMLTAAALQGPLPLYHSPYLLLLPAIFIISLRFGLGQGLAATLIAAVIADALFMGPRPGFQTSGREIVTSILFIVFSAFIVLVCDAVRRSALAQEASKEALRGLNDTLELRVRERTLALEEAQAALRQSQKMEALGQLTGGVAHDFNNVLAGVIGGLELARARLQQGLGTDAERYLALAEDSAQRGAALTRRLLAFSRREAGVLEPLDVAAVVAGMADLIGRTVGPGVSLSVEASGACGLASADRSQLENALLNLAINARDAMSGRGRLSLEVAETSVDAAEAAARAIAPGVYVRLTAQDSGCGMTPEVAARAFDPFFTTKPAGQGTGLGLSMVYAFVRQAGGGAWIDSTPGQGTRISLMLPRLRPADDASTGPAPSPDLDALLPA
jgi:signal transduction histidine kinase